MKIKNIILDIGGVLLLPRSGDWFFTPNFFNIVDEKLIDKELLTISFKKFKHLQTQEPKTQLQEVETFTNFYFTVLQEIHYPDLTLALAHKIATDLCYNDDKFIFFDEVRPFLKKLSKNYHLYIISNAWPSTMRILKKQKLDTYFNQILISYMYTTTKEEKLFNIFVDTYPEVNPLESLYIDDNLHLLEKAKTFDFHTIWLDRKHLDIPTKIKKVETLEAIYNVLDTY